MAALEQYVLFIDMMGFSTLVESEPDVATLTPTMMRALGPQYDPTAQYLDSDDEGKPLSPLIKKLGDFHRALATDYNQPRAATTMLFSDCCFMAFDDLTPAFFTAQAIVNWLLRRHVPVRVGLAQGTFVNAIHTSVQTASHSITAALFFGTGVTRAHKAEGNSILGCRAFVHPSVDIDQCQNEHLKHHFLRLPEPVDDAYGEVNLLFDGKWSEADLLGMSLDQMKPSGPPRVLAHYDATYISLRRMVNEFPNRYGSPLPLIPTRVT